MRAAIVAVLAAAAAINASASGGGQAILPVQSPAGQSVDEGQAGLPVLHSPQRYVAERCRCSFRVPDGWVMVANPRAAIPPMRPGEWPPRRMAPCAFGLRPRRWPRKKYPDDDRDFGRFAITIRVTNQRFHDAARDSYFARVDELRKEWNAPRAMSDKRATDWVILGRQDSRQDATWIRSKGWFGLRGTAAIGYYRIGDTGYRGMGDAYRAVLSNGRWRSAIFMADNPFTEAELDALIESFEFD